MFECHLDSEQVFGHDIHMSRTRVRRRRLALATMLTVGLAYGVPVAAGAVRTDTNRPRPVVAREYLVAPGDTLWRIAIRADPSRDPRQVIDQIERTNGVGPGSLQPGRVLVLPTAG
jgi:Tfp pilus assembly protein FimV